MNSNEMIIDPLGNEVLLPVYLCDLTTLGVDIKEVYDRPSKVIEALAVMMQVSGTFNENHYFRSIGWESSLLISTRKIDGKWTAHKIVCNPSSIQLGKIYNRGNNVNLTNCKHF